jgi:hypothetical protein
MNDFSDNRPNVSPSDTSKLTRFEVGFRTVGVIGLFSCILSIGLGLLTGGIGQPGPMFTSSGAVTWQDWVVGCAGYGLFGIIIGLPLSFVMTMVLPLVFGKGRKENSQTDADRGRTKPDAPA